MNVFAVKYMKQIKYWILCENTSTVAPIQVYSLEGFSLLFCRQQMKKLLFKLHLSLPISIMVLFDWTFYILLWRILLIPNCIKHFVAAFLLPVLVLILHYNFLLFLFSRIENIKFHTFQYLNINLSYPLPKSKFYFNK